MRCIDPCKEVRWDAFVASHPFGWITHLAGWKTVLQQAFPHLTPCYLALFDEHERIVAALPLFEAKSFLTGHRFVSLPFATLCDPLISHRQELDALFSVARGMLAKSGAKYIELRTHCASPLIPADLFSSVDSYKNHYMRLDKPLDALKASFHRSCVRQRIARAEKSGLTVRTARDETDLEAFYRLHCGMRKRLGLPAPPFSFLKSLWSVFFPSGQLSLLLSVFEGKVVGGIILLKFKERVSAEFLGWDEDYKHLSPTHHLFWQAIRAAHAEGRKIFDFGRSSMALDSLSTFKSRWGTSVAGLGHYYYPPDISTGSEDRETSLKYRIVQHMCRTLPEPASRLLGRFCYRHMA